MKKKYYIVPLEIVAKFQRSQIGDFALYFTQILTGEWVINVDCGEDLFNMIEWSTFEQRSLAVKDFPIE